MKKFYFFFKGSLAEKNLLMTFKNKGYLLESINGGWYTFKKNNALKHTRLAICFCEPDMVNQDVTNDKLIEKAIEKNLFFTKYKVIYYYITEENVSEFNQFTEINDSEANYLIKIKKIIFQFSLMMTFALILLWFFFTINEKSVYFSTFSIYFMFLIWLICFIFSKKYSRRIDLLVVNEETTFPEITVIINSNKKRLNMEELTYLGTWRYVTSKNNHHYYRLSTDISESDLKNDISYYLNINQTDVQFVSSLSLFPIG